MANLDEYVNKLNQLSENLYEDKVDVNNVEEDQLSTHVTAGDLNTIKQTLSTLLTNVNDINKHLISTVTEEEDSTTEYTLNQELNRYLANDYLRKNQIVVNGSPANDSVIYFDETYLRSKNIFVDGYKVSNTSPYNLVSWNEFNNRIKTVADNFNISTYIDDIKNSIKNIDGIYINDLTYGTTTIHTGNLYTPVLVDNKLNINITYPFQQILNNVSGHVFTVWNDCIGRDNTITSLIEIKSKHFTTVEVNEWGMGTRLIGNGYKIYSKNDILDPAFRQYKWFRVYNQNPGTTLNKITEFFDPQYQQNIIGTNFPTITTINSLNKSMYLNTSNYGSNSYVSRFKNYTYKQPRWDYMINSQGPTNGVPISYQFRTDPFYQGFIRGWMECGGQQRVYAEVKDGYVFFTPSSILFPIPFENGQGLDIQITAKRDNCMPFPNIIPISVLNEDTYFFDVIGGGQGLENGTSGFMFIKWEAKGVYLINNMLQYYYLQHGYDKIHDLYWIGEGTVNHKYAHIVKDSNPLSCVCDSEEEFRDVTTKDIVAHLYKEVFKGNLAQAIRQYQVNNGSWFIIDDGVNVVDGKVIEDNDQIKFVTNFVKQTDGTISYTEIASSRIKDYADANQLFAERRIYFDPFATGNQPKWYQRPRNTNGQNSQELAPLTTVLTTSLEEPTPNDSSILYIAPLAIPSSQWVPISYEASINKFVIDHNNNHFLKVAEQIENNTTITLGNALTNITTYPSFNKLLGFTKLKDFLGIMSGYAPGYISSEVSKLTSTSVYDAYNSILCPDDIANYLSGIIRGVWDNTKIRQYGDNTKTTTNIDSYFEANVKATIPAGYLWTYQKSGTNPNTGKPYSDEVYWGEASQPNSSVLDDDRMRLRSGITGQISSWLIYNNAGVAGASATPPSGNVIEEDDEN